MRHIRQGDIGDLFCDGIIAKRVLVRLETLGIVQLLPLPAHVDLKPGELGLVAHFLAARHPVAQIDIGQARLAGDFDVIEDDVVAQARLRAGRGCRRNRPCSARRQHIGQADADQIAFRYRYIR